MEPQIAQETKYSTPRLLSSLEEVAKTRTPIWDISGSGDVRIKLDTDVNGQEWYVIEDNSIRGGSFTGEVPCWAFPHFNGSHDSYSYVPVAFCFKTFASLLEEYPQHTKYEEWNYDEEEYTRRLEYFLNQDEQISSLLDETYEQAIDRKAHVECEEIFDWLTGIDAISEDSKKRALSRVDEFFAKRASQVKPKEEKAEISQRYADVDEKIEKLWEMLGDIVKQLNGPACEKCHSSHAIPWRTNGPSVWLCRSCHDQAAS